MSESSTSDHEDDRNAIIGNSDNFWLYSSRTGFDLTHPPIPASSQPVPALTLRTTTSPITVDPAKSALVIIDMQNFFLSAAFDRQRGSGHAALDELTRYAIPAARKAGIRIVWLNWGLTAQEVQEMPPAVTRAFGFEAVREVRGHGWVPVAVDRQGAVRAGIRRYRGLGSECGPVVDPDTGAEINAGKLLMRGEWNSGLYPPLDVMYEEGAKLKRKPDIWIHKNRMSGMSSGSTCEEFLIREGIRTLFFTGVNTDQCVGGTFTDSFSKGYDCILLNDGAATTSPEFAQQCFEYNAANTWGFATSCKDLAEGVEDMMSRWRADDVSSI